MINVIHNPAIMDIPRINIVDLINKLRNSNNEFIPEWSNLNYWFPEEFISLLSRAWGFVHSLKDKTKYLLLIPLINVTRYFSWGDEKVHKLYESKYSIKKIEELLKGDWKYKFYNMLEREVCLLLKKVREYNRLNPKQVKWEVKSGVDTLETKLEREVNILITSPPYLQAQEYIRSTKLELFWLGYNESCVKELSKKEMPYRDVKPIEIYSDQYFKYRERIAENHLRTLYDRYFYAILNAFSVLGQNVTDYMCIFVGLAKVRTMSIPIDEVIIEHLKEYRWKHEVTFVDRIVSRVMFESDINPASGEKDSRIKTEHLVVLRKMR